jgi:hypothetical protein
MPNYLHQSSILRSKHLFQTTFKPLNSYNKTCFDTAYLGENEVRLLNQKQPKMLLFLWATSPLSQK